MFDVKSCHGKLTREYINSRQSKRTQVRTCKTWNYFLHVMFQTSVRFVDANSFLGLPFNLRHCLELLGMIQCCIFQLVLLSVHHQKYMMYVCTLEFSQTLLAEVIVLKFCSL